MSEKHKDWSLSQIQALPPLQAIRKRPTMYAGPLDEPTLASRLILDGCCAALESAQKGEVSKIRIEILTDSSAVIADDGPGWDTTPRKCGTPWPVLMMTAIYACKMAKEESTEDLCVMGITVANALSSRARVSVTVGEHEYEYNFKEGNFTGQIEVRGDTKVKGTRILFELDTSILVEPKLDAEYLGSVIEKYSCAYGCHIEVIDLRDEDNG